MVTDEMIDLALAALNGGIIDGRRFWTNDDRSLMRAAIEAALFRFVDEQSYADLRASDGLQNEWEDLSTGGHK